MFLLYKKIDKIELEYIQYIYIYKRFLQRNTIKYISYEINKSRPIYTIYKAAKMFWNNLYSTKNPVFHSACVNLSLVKDLNPCRQDFLFIYLVI